jgi:hypothetical protein
MFNKLIIYSFILFMFAIIAANYYKHGNVLEGLDTDASSAAEEAPAPASSSSSDIGVTVGTYTTKIDELEKKINSMQSSILTILPTVTKNTSDNDKNKQAILAIIANKDKT